MATTPLMSPLARETLSFKETPKGESKAGIKFWLGRKSRTLFWCDLVEVAYDPDASETSEPGTDNESTAAVEKLVLVFHQQIVIITGCRLRRLDDGCQNHLIDFVRVSSRETVMKGLGSPHDLPLIFSIKIEKPEKKGGRKE